MAIVKSIVELSHQYLAEVVKVGDKVVDATAGKGGDTLFLANLVGEEGYVYAFDLQGQALNYTHNLLVEKGLDKRVRLIEDSHSAMTSYISQPVEAVVFNLGYLPGGDHTLTTTPETTIPGLQQGYDLLSPRGIMAISIYWGHPQGEAEKKAIEEFLQQPQVKGWQALEISVPNREKAPILLIIEKNEKGKSYGKQKLQTKDDTEDN